MSSAPKAGTHFLIENAKLLLEFINEEPLALNDFFRLRDNINRLSLENPSTCRVALAMSRSMYAYGMRTPISDEDKATLRSLIEPDAVNAPINKPMTSDDMNAALARALTARANALPVSAESKAKLEEKEHNMKLLEECIKSMDKSIGERLRGVEISEAVVKSLREDPENQEENLQEADAKMKEIEVEKESITMERMKLTFLCQKHFTDNQELEQMKSEAGQFVLKIGFPGGGVGRPMSFEFMQGQ